MTEWSRTTENGRPPEPPAEGQKRALRSEAQQRLETDWQARTAGSGDDSPTVRTLIHELSVHQVELEMQNEQLRQAQVELEASRARYLNLYQHAPVGYLTLGVRHVIVEANHLAGRLLGTPQSHLMSRRITDFMAPTERAIFEEQHAKLLNAREPQAFVVRLHRHVGGEFWAQFHLALVWDDVHQTMLCHASLSDVTERAKLQEDLARLAAIVSSSDDAIGSRDLEGRVTSWNTGAQRLYGYSEAEMLGETMAGLIPPERRGEEAQLLPRLKRGETVAHFESERIRKDGSRVPISLTVSPLRDEFGRVAGTSKIARDISASRAAERALHARMRQLDLLAQTGQNLILGDHADPALLQQVFDRVRSAIGAQMHVHFAPGPGSDTLVLASASGLDDATRQALSTIRMDDLLCGTVARRRMPLIIERLEACDLPQARMLQDLRARCYAGYALVAHETFFGTVAFIGTHEDHFKPGDLQVIQTVCDQVAATQERARLVGELRTTSRALQHADRKKDDFIATLAHELRNPLAPIRNAVSILQRQASSDPQLQWCRGVIERQVGQMSRLLEDLLDVSRITRNKVSLRCQRIELAHAMEQALEATRPLIEGQQHELRFHVPSEPILLEADLTRLTQVFANLLSNAAKYTEPGGRIMVDVTRQDREVAVSVTDTGIGIPAEQLQRIFDMFAQLTPALDRSHGGLGIGLALVRGLVELHGGRIEAHSAGLGMGSRFVVYLPMLPSPSAVYAPAPGSGTAANAERTPLRILVVDDNLDAAETLSMMLQLDGHEVQVAGGGREGFERAREAPPDVAVLDLGMPDLNGYELCRMIRGEPWGRDMLVIACTGWGQGVDREHARDAGFNHHVVKPVEPAAFAQLLGTARRRPSTGT